MLLKISVRLDQHYNDLLCKNFFLLWVKEIKLLLIRLLFTHSQLASFNNTRVLRLSHMPSFPMGAEPEEGSASSQPGEGADHRFAAESMTEHTKQVVSKRDLKPVFGFIRAAL